MGSNPIRSTSKNPPVRGGFLHLPAVGENRLLTSLGTPWVQGFAVASLRERPENTNKPYTVRWREGGANRRRSFRRKREATAFLTEALTIEQAERDGHYTAPASLRRRTLGDQWRTWTATRAHLSESTQDKDRWVWNRWLKDEIGHRRLGTLTHHDLSRLLSKVTASGAGPDTRIAVYSRLNMLLDDALGRDGHSCRRATAGSTRRKRTIRPLADAELERLLNAVPEQWKLLVDIIATLGVRPHEALQLTSDDVSGGTLTVRSRKGKGQTRKLPLPSRLAAPLAAAAEAVDDGPLWEVPDYRVWRRRVFKPAAARAGLAGIVPYDLRHTCASKLISKGATPTDVAEWMGHSVKMTLETYSHLFPGRRQELAGLLDR